MSPSINEKTETQIQERPSLSWSYNLELN